MPQFYVRVSRGTQTVGEHSSDDEAAAQKVFDDLKTTAPVGCKIDFRDFSRAESLVDSHVVKKVS